MARYSITNLTIDEDDPPPPTLSRIGGPVVGLPTERWPRHRGRCMQHAFTLDLDGLELHGIPRAKGMRALSVFVESYYEQDLDSSDGITVVWLSQADVDAHPETEPPPDFVAETLGESMQDQTLVLDPLDEGDEARAGECHLGGEPAWHDAGAPAQRPTGAFVLQVNSWTVPFTRPGAQLVVFEDGGYVQREYDDDGPVPWPEAIARSRRIVVLDQPPPEGTLQKWGGIPRGVSEGDWPSGASHLFTYVPPEWPEGEEGAAVAVFGRLSKTSNWGEQPGCFEALTITQEALDDEEPTEVPDDVPVLDERTLELVPFAADASWRDLQTSSFVGPRAAWRDPGHHNAQSTTDPVLQVASELLPNAPGRGSLCFLAGSHPWWLPEPGAPQAEVEAYRPDGTLYGDDTTAAVVVGHRIDFERYAILPEQVEALEKSVLAALRARGLDLTLYVPGDTTTNPDDEVPAKFVLGRAVATTEANEWEPSALDPVAAQRLREDFPALDAAFWQEALAGFEDAEASEAPAAHLLSWGPLCYGALYVGVPRSKDDPEPPVHEFVANQDMNQEWSTEGIDGVRLVSVEFSDIDELSLSPIEDLAQATPLPNPGYWLICRYD
jgi:hypothetical protein